MSKSPIKEFEFIGSIYAEAAHERLLEISEVGDFAVDASQLLSADEIEQMKTELACLRQLGSIIKGTDGLRKFRWGAKGKGKRGGVRVLYYYGGDHMPIFLIAIFAKSEMEDISEARKKAIRKLIKCLVEENQPRQVSPKLKVVQSVKGKKR